MTAVMTCLAIMVGRAQSNAHCQQVAFPWLLVLQPKVLAIQHLSNAPSQQLAFPWPLVLKLKVLAIQHLSKTHFHMSC